jgi:hypothetical protein
MRNHLVEVPEIAGKRSGALWRGTLGARMAESDEWEEWHLTPRGWEQGSERVDFKGTTERPVPADRMLTFRWRELMTSRFWTPAER